MFLDYAELIGTRVISYFKLVGEFTLFGKRVLVTFIKTPLHRKQLVDQMKLIGVDSFGIIFLVGCSIGLALAVQTYLGFVRVHAEQFTGLAVTLGIARELGPVITGLIVTGRVGSAITAELSSMAISEQIDALKTLCIDPFYYLIVPRILASTLMMPFVTLFTMIFGMSASYIFCIYSLNINPEAYMSSIREYMELKDITGGLIKASFFGLIFSWVGCYIGYHGHGGARGVGMATTHAVVISSILILIGNFMLTSFLRSAGIS